MCPNLVCAGWAGSREFARVCTGLRGFARVCAGLRRFRGKHSTFARSGADFMASAASTALLQGQVHVVWQAQHFRKVRYRFRGTRGFARGACAGLRGLGQVSWQAQHFRKVRRRSRGRRNTFDKVRYRFLFMRGFALVRAGFMAGAALSQGQVQMSRQGQHLCGHEAALMLQKIGQLSMLVACIVFMSNLGMSGDV